MTIKPSFRFAMVLLLMHAMVAVVVYLTVLPLGAKLAMLLLILLTLIYYFARDTFLLLPYSWSEVLIDQEGMAVIKEDGSKLFGLIEKGTIVSSCFIVLRIKQDGQSMTVSRLIFPDALKAGVFREFCIRLRFA